MVEQRDRHGLIVKPRCLGRGQLESTGQQRVAVQRRERTGVVAGRPHAAESVPMAPLQHGINRRDHRARGSQRRLERAGGEGGVGLVGVLDVLLRRHPASQNPLPPLATLARNPSNLGTQKSLFGSAESGRNRRKLEPTFVTEFSRAVLRIIAGAEFSLSSRSAMIVIIRIIAAVVWSAPDELLHLRREGHGLVVLLCRHLARELV